MVVMLVVACGTKHDAYVTKVLFLERYTFTINIESRQLRTTFGWPEGHGLGSSEGDDGCSVLQGCETNGEMIFASSNR
jgi:hypothetical protein